MQDAAREFCTKTGLKKRGADIPRLDSYKLPEIGHNIQLVSLLSKRYRLP